MVTVTVLERKFNNLKIPLTETAEELMRRRHVQNRALNIYIIGDSFMDKKGQSLLEQYRRVKNIRNKKNISGFNVLSFSAPAGFPEPDIDAPAIGEIYLNPDYIKRSKENITYLLIHGFLHLLGYDHGNDNDRIKMEKAESELYKNLR